MKLICEQCGQSEPPTAETCSNCGMADWIMVSDQLEPQLQVVEVEPQEKPKRGRK